MMLLIGMKMSFTKKPTNPITTKPIAVRTATLENSDTTITKRIVRMEIHGTEIQIKEEIEEIEEGELGF